MADTTKGVLLIVGEEPLDGTALRSDLANAGYTVLAAPDAGACLKLLAEARVDVVIADLRTPGNDGIQLLPQIKRVRPNVPVIVTAAGGSIDSAVESMRLGAADYVTRPFAAGALIAKIERLQASATAEQAEPDLDQLFGRAAALAGRDTIQAGSFVMPSAGAPRMMAGLTETIAGVERTLIDAALRRAAGNQAKAAQFLRIPRTTLRDKMAKYGMVAEGKADIRP